LTYAWRADGALSSVSEVGAVTGPGVLARYHYDARGRVDRVERGNGVVSTYGWNGLDRLTSLSHDAVGTAGDMSLGFTYGSTGEMLTRSLDNGSYAVPLPASGDVAGVVDALNRLVSVGGTAIGHDTAGRVETDGTSHYLYDGDGRLVAVTPQGGGGEGVGLFYDVLGRLSRIAPGSGVGAVNLAYDGLDVVAELDDAGTVLRRYAHGAGLGQPLVEYAGADTDSRRWLLADERGSVVGLSDGSGSVTSVNTYDEYGVPGSGNSGLFQYTGQMRIEPLLVCRRLEFNSYAAMALVSRAA
ncbi:hypothetical protein, partial [Niveispirillum sp. KHB5.9]|uniref:hypothetical protein n=1 Tax=Niveispirillum sp. KHB5.9 TaxID=3400269 RepID=UPI003A852FA7